ncbi:MAG: hypothetical protein KDB00_13070 [Planctomycetales bacterium]|nr:hypothetical protein [Planctomycetales bacterium]
MSGPIPVDEIKSPAAAPQQSGKIICGACNAGNPAGGQFCASCGHALYEPCGECTKPVLLSQSFCGSCGADLLAAVAKRKVSMEAKIAEAISATKERNFDRAKELLAVVAREKDFRFSDVVGNAKVAQKKIESIAVQESASASDRIAAAQEAYECGDSVRVVELLGTLSPNLLTPEATSNLKRSQTRLDQIADADKSLQEAFQKRDWAASGVIIDRMMELKPDDESISNLALKVGKKLISKAESLRESHKYGAAANLLECVPGNARNEAFSRLQGIVDRNVWLSGQFKDEPLATPTLGRLAKSWVEQSGGDPQATAMLNRISKRIREPKSTSRDLFPPLFGSCQSWVGGKVGVLAFPACIDAENEKQYRSLSGQFNVAIGLAMQGLGLGRIKEDFSPKKGLLKRLSRKKTERCWGLDVGASGLKAVCLEAVENGNPKLVECYKLAFDAPMLRGGTDSSVDDVIREGVEKFLSEHDVETTPVWVSFPARELVSRFVKLPPVADKQANVLFDKEVETRIPLPLDEVCCVRWIAPYPDDEKTTIGRPAFVSAAKKQFVDRYLENLGEAGLTVAGLQATPLALINFASREFADLFEAEPGEDHFETKLPTVALFDCGAEMTIVLLISGASCWFWSFESGGNEFTRLLSRATTTTHSEAEKLKRNPASLERPDVQFEMVEARIEEMHGRLQKVVSDVLKEYEEFEIQQTWACGGGSLTHGWIKRILCES